MVVPITLSPGRFVTGSGSPVSIASSTALEPSSTAPSTGTFSPGRTRRVSPTWTWVKGTSSSVPSGLMRRAVFGASPSSDLMAAGTRAAFAGALSTLRKVSRERIRDELLKLLSSDRPAVGLRLLLEQSADNPTLDWGIEGNMLQVVLPELAHLLCDAAQVEPLLLAVESLPKDQRLGALLWPLRQWLPVDRYVRGDCLDRRSSKLPVSVRQHLLALLTTPLVAAELVPFLHGAALRRLLAEHPAALLDDMLAIERAYAAACGDAEAVARLTALTRRIVDERARRPALSMAELALSGKDLLRELPLPPGPVVGELLRELLAMVIDDPAHNDRAVLLEHAKNLLSARKIKH